MTSSRVLFWHRRDLRMDVLREARITRTAEVKARIKVVHDVLRLAGARRRRERFLPRRVGTQRGRA